MATIYCSFNVFLGQAASASSLARSHDDSTQFEILQEVVRSKGSLPQQILHSNSRHLPELFPASSSETFLLWILSEIGMPAWILQACSRPCPESIAATSVRIVDIYMYIYAYSYTNFLYTRMYIYNIAQLFNYYCIIYV